MMIMGELDLNGNGGKKGSNGGGQFVHHLMEVQSGGAIHSKYPLQQGNSQVHACHPALLLSSANHGQSPNRNVGANFQTPYAMTSMVTDGGSTTNSSTLDHMHSSPHKSVFFVYI